MPANRVVELRLFRIHPGRRDQFMARFHDQLLPMVKRQGIEVIAHGPSLHDEDSFFLVRAYPSVEARAASLDAMYGGAEWLMNQEEDVLGMIDSFISCVVEAEDQLIEAMKSGFVKALEPDAVPPGWR